jgi:hypothetical protein
MSKLKALALAMSFAVLTGPALAAVVTDIRPIGLKPGVNRVPRMAPDGRDGIIVQGNHSDSPIADGGSIQFLVLLQDHDNWQTIGVQAASKPGTDEELIVSVPHVGEDWKRTVTFARAKVDGAPAFVMLVAERDMAKAVNVYTPVPVEVRTYRLQPNTVTVQDHLALIDRKPAPGCYQNAWLALKEVTGVPLPEGYEGPTAPETCPK